jgi:hypothetical protein
LTKTAKVNYSTIDVDLPKEGFEVVQFRLSFAEVMTDHQVRLLGLKNDAARLAQRQQSPKDQEPATQKTHQSMIAVTIWIS